MELEIATIQAAQRGDPAAQSQLLCLYARRLRYLVAQVEGKQEIDDFMQDLYLKILEALPRYRCDGPARFGTWIFTVAHHWLISHKRRPLLRLVSIDNAATVADPGPPPDRIHEAREIRAEFDRAVSRLSSDQRRVFILAVLYRQPLDAIAETEGVPLGTVKSRLHRARAGLALALAHLTDEGKGGVCASVGGS